MEKLELESRPSFQEYQEYVRKLELERGFSDQTAIEKCLLLGEEINKKRVWK